LCSIAHSIAPAIAYPSTVNAPPLAQHFVGRTLDDAPLLLAQSYRLRYEVYCLERQFLPAERYPTGLESDEFDTHAIHVGAFDAFGALAGTSRAVKVSASGLPLFDHCTPFPHETEFHRTNPRLLEVGRLVVGQGYRRRRHDVESGAGNASKPDRTTDSRQGERRCVGEDAFMTVLEALYQATGRIGATHWVTAMEEPLRRQLVEQGFPFRAFGPETEYYGRVVPYQMSLHELDRAIRSGRFPELELFAVGREAETSVPIAAAYSERLDSGLRQATIASRPRR
jgi:N-acyl amino acid synthase of PEP-CTERM/exosortase system